jgi:hypothetical protein
MLGEDNHKSIIVTKRHSNSGSWSGSLSPITMGYDKLTRYAFRFCSFRSVQFRLGYGRLGQVSSVEVKLG